MQPSETFADRFRLERQLGAGSMATTWLARDLVHASDVTLKVLRDPALAGALRREFARLRSLRHDALVTVHDFGAAEAAGQRVAYYSARYVEGTELGEWARGEAPERLRAVLANVLRALAYLHASGVRHGDLKPANVIVGSDGRGVVIDLGCASALDGPPGSVSGTPGFIAPELLAGDAVDHRADLFSLGKTLEALAPARPEAWPAPLYDLMTRCLHRDPAARPVDAASALELLGEPARVVGAGRSTQTALLGRGAAMREAAALVDRLLAGEPGPRALWVHGPEGAGRSRLLRELKWEAQLRCDVVELLAPDAAIGDAEAPGPQLVVLDDLHAVDDQRRAQLMALARTLPERGARGIVVTSLDPAPSPFSPIAIGPLDAGDVARWCRGRVPDARVDDVMALTGGYPGSIAALLALVTDADRGADDLARLGDLRELSPRRLAALRALSPGGREGLARLCLEDGRAAAGALAPDVVAELERGRWVERDARGVALPRLLDAGRWLAAMDPRELRDLRIELAEDALATQPARAARWLAEAGEVERAEALLPESGPARGFARAADAVIEAGPSEAGRLVAARVTAEHGHPERALAYLAPLRTPTFAARLLEGECRFRLGELDRAERALEEAREAAEDGAERAMALDVLARCAARRGDHGRALELAEAGFDALGSDASHPALRARLLEDRGVALSYQGEYDEADRALESASRLARAAAPRDRVRIASYRGINAYRSGRTPHAASCHREALGVAEEHGLSDYVATCALNLGSAQHQLGDWGPALASYERGLDVARALGKASTRRTLEFDIAKLLADVGLFDRAERRAAAVEAEAEAEGLAFWIGAAASIRGEASLASGRLEEAREALDRAGAALTDAPREHAEVELTRAQVLWASGRDREAAALVDALDAAVGSLDGPDLQARLAMARARAASDEAETIEWLEEARARAAASGQRMLRAEVERRLAWFWAERGSRAVASRHADAARHAWQRTEGLLPPALREAFWRHPDRALPELTVSDAAPPGGPDDPRFGHLLTINRKLNSSLEPRRVLDATIDAAIELTGAERGFVILADPDTGALEVAVARNLDREKVPRSHLKVSHSIAERVVETAEPVLTVDARQDPRFKDQASVHAMKLRSVMSVPIRSPEGVLGALYLDNRFRAERFGRRDLELLLAFSDQAALAIRNARLVAALESEKARVEELARGQALQIDALEHKVRVQSEALASRYDYSHIIGQSDPMRRVFSLLDRVTANEVTVLVQGESGTGKELVARAIHFNGPRRDGPFVAINCGALPDTLLESELFGHVKGAFTGAVEDKDGLFVSARGGTVFLDEVGEMSEAMQVKLLRVLQERVVRPVGRSHELPVDVRVLAATNRDLAEEAREGRFREDLYYRLAVVDVRLPPLRERMDDLQLLVEHLLTTIAEEIGTEPKPVRDAALRRLAAHDWPGNVRELRNVLARAFVLAEDAIEARDVALERRGSRSTRRERDEEERERLAQALEDHEWRVVDVARSLSIPRSTLYRKLKRHGLRRKRPKPN